MHRRCCFPLAVLLLAITAVFTTAVRAQVPRYCILRKPIPAFGGAPCYEFYLADCTNTTATQMCTGDAATATATAYATRQGWEVDPNAHPPGVGLFVNWEAADSMMNVLSPYGGDYYECFGPSTATLPPRIPLGPQSTVGLLGPGGTKYVILRKPEFSARPNCYEFYLVDVTGANARAYIDAGGVAWVTGIGAREGWEVDPTLGGPYINWEAADSSMSKLSRYGGNLYCCGCTPVTTPTPQPTRPPRTPRPRPTRPVPGSAPTAPPPPATIPPTPPPTPPPTIPPTPPPTIPPTPPPTMPPTPPPTIPPTPPPTIPPTPPLTPVPTIPATPLPAPSGTPGGATPPPVPTPQTGWLTSTPLPGGATPMPQGGVTPQTGWLTSTPPAAQATPAWQPWPPSVTVNATPFQPPLPPATPKPPPPTPPSNENPFDDPSSQGYIDNVTNNQQNRTDGVVVRSNTDDDSVIARGPRTYTQGTLVSNIRSTINWVRTTPPPPATPVATAPTGPGPGPARTPPPPTPVASAPQPAKSPFQPSSGLTNVTVSKRTITVTFWDHGTEDGDIINILLNGQVIQGGITLTKAPRSINITINDSNAVFGVQAVNEGKYPPNTASVRFSDVTTGKPVQVYSIKSGQKADMSITYGGQ